ncbi:DUF4384 domain-containing protein [Chitinimonas koreensis]|uniref:DUF4384 domain-containing protein n=1 Tax=Chitinimonas koreensis TaxID=356302 RepID=UPI000425C3EA|nr:DUF4384 domain-containing protein [Chitinimonas koreensis]QNM98586.1 DUF4384 domain-containing protein [Chitinimonas koreensis]
MKKSRAFGLALALGLAAALPAQATQYAYILTVGDYGGQYPSLSGTRIDRQTAHQIALRAGVAEENIVHLVDGQATKAAMQAMFEEILSRTSPNDQVLIYFSGHGIRAKETDSDKCAEGLLAADGGILWDSELSQYLDRLGNRLSRTLMVVDACHSGGANKRFSNILDGELLTPKFATKLTSASCSQAVNLIPRTRSAFVESEDDPRRNVVYVAMARDNEVAFDHPLRGGLGTFSLRQCLDANRNADANRSGAISIGELLDCAQGRLNDIMADNRGVRPSTLTAYGNPNAAFALPPAPVQASAPAQPAAAAPAAEPAVHLNPATVLSELYSNRDGRRKVEVKLDNPAPRIGVDRIGFEVTSSHAGYVYVLMLGSDGKTVDLIFPNALDGNHAIAAGGKLTLPRSKWRMKAAGPAGQTQLLTLVFDQPKPWTTLPGPKVGPFSSLPAALAGDLHALLGALSAPPAQGRCEGELRCEAQPYGAALSILKER